MFNSARTNPSHHSVRPAPEQSCACFAREVYFQVDTVGVWVSLNAAWTRLTGFSIARTLQTSFFNYVYADDRQRMRNFFYQLLSQPQETAQCETRLVNANGQIFWVAVSLQLVRRDNGEVEGLRGTLLNINDLKRSQALVKLLQDLIQSVSQAADFHTAIQVLLQQVCDFGQWDYGEVWMATPDRAKKEVLQLIPVWYGQSEALETFHHLSQAYTYPVGSDLAGRVWVSQQPEWILDLPTARRSRFSRAPIAAEIELQAAFAAPILVGSQTFAVLVFLIIHPCPNDSQIAEILTSTVMQLGAIIQGKQTEEALRQTEEKYRSIFENATEGIFQATPTGCYLSANPALAKIYGYDSPAELIAALSNVNRPFYVLASRRAEYIALLNQHGHLREFESQIYRRDGQIIWISENVRTVRDAVGQVRYYEGTVTDITERKHMELALENTLSLVRAAFDSISEGMIVVDLANNLMSYNRKFLEMWAMPETVLVDREQRLQFMANQLQDGSQFLDRVQNMANQPSAELFYLLELKDGRIFEQYTRPQEMGKTIVGRVWNFRDITERKQAELALAASEAKFRSLIQNSSDLITILDGNGNILYQSPSTLRILSYAPDTLVGRNWFNFIHPEDRPLVLYAFHKVIANPGEALSVEYRFRRPDESWCFMASTGTNLLHHSSVGGIVLNSRDVTPQKQIELDLLRQQEQSEQLLLNVLPIPIAERLKQGEQTIAEHFPEVTVLFADLVNFSQLAEQMTADELVRSLNQIFSVFDLLTERHGLEKIKTIGDAYMVVGGLPTLRDDHAEAVADMALDMQRMIARFPHIDHSSFTLRIGIHTGPVVAGIIGIKKFSYDLWGDTVNIASRMESQGMPGKIQVSAVTYERLKQKYDLEERGTIAIKGKGEMQTYFLLNKHHEGSKKPD